MYWGFNPLNAKEWAKEHLEPNENEMTVMKIVLDYPNVINPLVDILECTRYRAGVVIQKAMKEGYTF